MLRRALEWFGGSVIVYVLVVACGSPSNGGSKISSSAAGESSEGGAQGTGGVNGEAGEDGARDGGILNPVPDAMAAAGADGKGDGTCECPDPYVPPKPIVVEAECDIQGGSGAMFAEAEFPGKSAAELARVLAVIEFDYDIADKFAASAPPGYPAQVSNLFVRDGYVATYCGSAGHDHIASRVVFTLP